MSHNPVNHPAQPVYRAISGLIGIYLVIFGGLGIIETAGGTFFAQSDVRVLGQGTNIAHSLLSIGLGLVVLIAAIVGRNVDVRVNKPLAYAFMALAVASLAVLRTDANVLNFSVATCIVTMVIGLALLLAAMYGKVGSDDEHQEWQKARLIL
ncbi:MAG TPA: DUF4383 domain-containing protein [Micromonosporaceae bacterium]